MPRRRAALGLGVLTLAFLGLQLVRPEAPGPVPYGDGPLSEHVTVPAEVAALLRRSCYDCHSGQTRWPWYSRVSPVSWLIVHDVRHGRSNLDFDHWYTDPVREPTPAQRLGWICREAREGLMPPKIYLIVHPAARLSESETDRLCTWTARALSELEASEETVLGGPRDGG